MGVGAGDRVVLSMPMVPEAVIGMLACARLGAVHSVVFGGFAAEELAVRIDDAQPKVILSASCGIEPNRVVAYKPLLDEAIQLARHKPARVLMVDRGLVAAVRCAAAGAGFPAARGREEAGGPLSRGRLSRAACRAGDGRARGGDR